jgi:hypothetical protein
MPAGAGVDTLNADRPLQPDALVGYPSCTLLASKAYASCLSTALGGRIAEVMYSRRTLPEKGSK